MKKVRLAVHMEVFLKMPCFFCCLKVSSESFQLNVNTFQSSGKF